MNSFKIALRTFALMTVLTGILYPLFITLVAHLAMPQQSEGSLLRKDNQIVGSFLIAQQMHDDRYFWPRPSAIGYNPIHPSGGSNLGPTSKKLKKLVDERKQKIGKDAPPELLYASGSGLDPHITLKTAYYQIPRVAKARSIQEGDLKHLVNSLDEGKQLGFLGPRYVNVLLLNQTLEQKIYSGSH
jgi:K+-transporting ATPase ATPase C chain